MTLIQRGLFCFTTMVTVATLLKDFFGIQNLISTVLIGVLVFAAFFVRFRRRADQ
jgi:hypothetical protein